MRRIAKCRFSDFHALQSLDRLAAEQLDDPDILGDLEGRPIGALVAKICFDLGLAPRWLDLSQEAWAQAEIAERPPGSPYAAWPDLPPEEPDPEDPDLWDPDDDFEDDDDDDEDEDEPDASVGTESCRRPAPPS